MGRMPGRLEVQRCARTDGNLPGCQGGFLMVEALDERASGQGVFDATVSMRVFADAMRTTGCASDFFRGFTINDRSRK